MIFIVNMQLMSLFTSIGVCKTTAIRKESWPVAAWSVWFIFYFLTTKHF